MKQVEERYISLLTDFGFDRLFEEAEIAKFTPQEMREYETSKMAYRDIKNSVDTAKREGIAEGKEIGMKEGMEKGSLFHPVWQYIRRPYPARRVLLQYPLRFLQGINYCQCLQWQ